MPSEQDQGQLAPEDPGTIEQDLRRLQADQQQTAQDLARMQEAEGRLLALLAEMDDAVASLRGAAPSAVETAVGTLTERINELRAVLRS